MLSRIGVFGLLLLLALPLRATAETEVREVSLRMQATVGGKGHDSYRAGVLGLTLHDGKVVAGRIGKADHGFIGGWDVSGWTGRVDRVDVKLANGRLAGTVDVTISSNAVRSGTLRYVIDAKVDGDAVRGQAQLRAGEEVLATTPCEGTIGSAAVVAPSARDALVVIALDRALPRGEVLRVHLDCRGGRIVTAFGFASSYSRRPFDVDASGLRVEDARIAGDIVVTRLSRDDSDTAGQRLTFGKYAIDVKLADHALRGWFTGTTVENEAVRGDAWGDVMLRGDDLATTGKHRVFVKLEDGLVGGADWQNRVFFNLDTTDGKAATGKVNNNKGVYSAELRGAVLEWDGKAFAGTLDCVVVDGSISKGSYRIRLDGRMIGRDCCGRFQTRLEDKDVKTGYFIGRIEPSRRD